MKQEKMASFKQDYQFRFRYETLRSLLNKNGSALQILSDLEADLNHMRYYDKRIQQPIQQLITESLLMAQELNLMTADYYSDLYDVIFQLRNKVDHLFSRNQPDGYGDQPFVLWLDKQAGVDPALVGGKAFGVQTLSKYFKDCVPLGFVSTTAAYHRIIEDNQLYNRIRILINNLDVTENQAQFQSQTQIIRRLIREAVVSPEIETAIMEKARALEQRVPDILWAVRSSAVSEDSAHSFAGLFDSELYIKTENLLTAYRHVLSSRFTNRAVKYRIHHQFREVDTPMAVLFMPMVDPVAAGVVYTTDLKNPELGVLEISAVPGLSNHMVKGKVLADTFRVVKEPSLKIAQIIQAEAKDVGSVEYLLNEKVIEIARLAIKAADKFGYELDIEWAVDQTGKIYFLQARQLNIVRPDEIIAKVSKGKETLPIIEGGITVFPGRAEGPLQTLRSGGQLTKVPEGAIVLVDQPRPELASILPNIAALLVIEGNPVGHLATLVREFAVPCIFRIGKNAALLLSGKNIISINATKRTVYNGTRWPGIRERVLARIAEGNRNQKKSGPLYDLLLRLNLLDPDASSFKAISCKSVHDTLRFMHEMSVRSMFGFGDKQTRGWYKKSRKLITDLPVKFQLIDLDHSIPENVKKINPKRVESVPFQALWRGISDKRLVWPERWEKTMRGMPSDFKETVLGGYRGPRRRSDKNYAIISRDYMNLNARFAYHYTMVDAMVGPGTEHNHVHFRFRGGGAGEENKKRRARFLERVLREFGFGVDRSGNLVTAWFRRYPQKDSENALEFLGHLIVCARQLDAVLISDAAIKLYAEYFLNHRFDMFG
jgi:pyruvate,water dikinase